MEELGEVNTPKHAFRGQPGEPLENLHIVHVLNTLQMGGSQRAVLGLATSAALSGCKHTVVCMSGPSGSLEPEFRAAGVAVKLFRDRWPDPHLLAAYRLWQFISDRLMWTFPSRMAAALEELHADLVHTHIISRIDLQAEAVVQRAKLPWVWTIRCQHEPEGPTLAGWRRAAQMAKAGRACITAVSKTVADDFAARQVCPEMKVEVVYTGADLSHFGVRPRDPAWRSANRIPEHAVLFGAVGRLEPIKAHEVFVTAAAALARWEPNAHFVVVGDGPLRGQLISQICTMGLNGRFHLIGEQGDMPHYYPQLDVFVMPSFREGFSTTIIEALASGVPCIGTSLSGMREILDQADLAFAAPRTPEPLGGMVKPSGLVGGIVVRGGCPESLATAMQAMLAPDVRRQYALSAPAIARYFSRRSSTERFAQIYSSLVSRQ